MSFSFEIVLVAVLGVVAVASGAALLRMYGMLKRQRVATAVADQRVSEREAEAAHLASRRLPALIESLDRGAPDAATGDLRHPHLAGTGTDIAYQQVLEQVRAALVRAAEQADDAAGAAVQSATRSLQPLVYELQRAVSGLVDTARDDQILGLVHRVDHSASQLARRLQTLGVLTGTWPGRQREDTLLLEAVRGGVSRIRDYGRVKTPRPESVHLAGRYVEPLGLLLAELMDNGARHSAPTTPVEISVLETHTGVSIEVHDAGPGMPSEVLAEARRRVGGRDRVRFTKLGTPAAYGLLGVGVIAGRYGFRVGVDSEHSRHGGIRVVVQVPRSMLVAPPLPTPEPAVQSAVEHPPNGAPGPGPALSGPSGSREPAPSYAVAEDGLPVRRSRHAAPSPGNFSLPEAEPPPEGAGRSLAAFVQGTRRTLDPQEPQP
ncbi:sensor histidine kinase [Streptomyces halstedii]|uniref:histidine kinase n=1 Tax=Streptomyces halstedii TaxID=1944 RepID=A0A6N9UET6_STRHA|nr:sensor histidine kinase [Streptomyces halstedii]NEA20673.1 sensor histidine kinase [Streptomyces halstedii]